MTPSIGGVELIIQHRNKTEQMAYSAGYDCGMNGANTHNCNFSFFNTPEMTRQWELGKKEADTTKEKVLRVAYGVCANCEEWTVIDINSDRMNSAGKREIDYRCHICNVKQSWIGKPYQWDSSCQEIEVEKPKGETRGRKKKQFDQTYILGGNK